MTRRQIFIITLFLLVLMFTVPAVLAQDSLEDIQLADIIDALGPRSGMDLLWDIFLYTIFLLGMINMALIPEKQLMASLLNFLIIGLAVVSKLLVGDHNSAIFAKDDLETMVLNIGMFVTPMLIAGMLRSHRGKKSKAMMPAIFMGIVGGAYFFLFWAVEQNDNQRPEMIPTPELFLDYFM